MREITGAAVRILTAAVFVLVLVLAPSLCWLPLPVSTRAAAAAPPPCPAPAASRSRCSCPVLYRTVISECDARKRSRRTPRATRRTPCFVYTAQCVCGQVDGHHAAQEVREHPLAHSVRLPRPPRPARPATQLTRQQQGMQQPQSRTAVFASAARGRKGALTHLLPPPSLTLFPNRMLRPANRPRRARPHMVAAFWPDMARG